MANLPRILVVEDDPRLSALIRDYLGQQGFDVSIEERGDHAVARIQQEQPDLLILDLMLAANSGQVLGREHILSSWRGISYDGLDRSVDITVSRLRRKLGDDLGQPRRIKTIWGQGYLFVRDAW